MAPTPAVGCWEPGEGIPLLGNQRGALWERALGSWWPPALPSLASSLLHSLFLACLTQLVPEGFIHSQLEKGLMAPITLTMFAG